MRRRSPFLLGFVALLVLPACTVFDLLTNPPPSHDPVSPSLIDRLAPIVRSEFGQLAGPAQTDWLAAHAVLKDTPGQFKRRFVVDTLRQPWEGLSQLEHQGHILAKLAEGGAVNLPAILDVLEANMDRTSTFQKSIPLPRSNKLDDLVNFMVESVEEAARQRDKALENVTDADKHFLLSHAHALVTHFSPQIVPTEGSMVQAQADLRFMELLEHRLDYGRLIGAAQILARLANEQWLHALAHALAVSVPVTLPPAGVTGDVRMVRSTAYGLIIVGGPGPNTYRLDHTVCLLIDLGGNDIYRGAVAASGDADLGNAVIIDLDGDDRYEGASLDLATGRLGIGLLVDHSGNDVYQLEPGSGGAGFGGIGILFDAKGNDTYHGNRLTLGAAIGGLGLLFDMEGDDHYTVPGFGIGFGGPLGVGAVIDVSGQDRYQCGGAYPSAYNQEDAPNARPGDPLFQYDCFGLGAGSGQRLFTKRPEWQAKSLAGGWGVLLDVEGNDRYDSANFSQGHGYFWGAGLKLDLGGNDVHHGARYGHGSAAHFGISLFVDQNGDDRYASSGPYYNGGVAWDHSVGLLIDGGSGHDSYAFERSTGLGRADYGGWALFIDEGGPDQYSAQSGFGETSEKAIAAFFDLSGQDTYTVSSPAHRNSQTQPQNGKSFPYPHGGIFVDH